MSRNPVRVRIHIVREGMHLRTEGKSPRGSVYALRAQEVLRDPDYPEGFEADLAAVIGLLCPNTVRK